MSNPAARSAVAAPQPAWSRISSQHLGIVLPYVLLVALFLIGAALIEGFTTWPSLRSMLVIAAFLGIASIGQTLTIVLGGIDLSIPAVIGMANVITIQLYGKGTPFALVMLVVLASGAAVGLVNGGASQLLRAHPLIVTLATGSIVGSATLIVGEGNSVGSIPTWLTDAVSPGGTTFGFDIPTIVLVWLACSLGVIALQRLTVFGRYLYALGSNPVAARMALVRPTRVWLATYVVSGVFAAITGVLLAGFSSGADPNIGDTYLFLSIAAVVVGGTSLLGGSGGYGRTIVGVLAINLLTTILVGQGYDENLQQILLGVLIILLVGIYGRQVHVRDQI